MTIDIDFVGLKGVAERMDKVDRCLGYLADLRLDETDPMKATRVSVGPPLVTVDDASKYRGQLLDVQLERLRDVATMASGAAQFHPNDTRCTSLGQVRITDRTLAGVKLVVDMQCATQAPQVHCSRPAAAH